MTVVQTCALPIYNESSSIIGMPAISLPLLSVEDVPLGVQLQGYSNGDEALTASGRWISLYILNS